MTQWWPAAATLAVLALLVLLGAAWVAFQVMLVD